MLQFEFGSLEEIGLTIMTMNVSLADELRYFTICVTSNYEGFS